MKIISSPKVDNWCYRHTCVSCDSELEVDKNDLNYEYLDQREGESFFTHCPVCSCRFDIGVSKIPKLIGIQIRNRMKNDCSLDRF